MVYPADGICQCSLQLIDNLNYSLYQYIFYEISTEQLIIKYYLLVSIEETFGGLVSGGVSVSRHFGCNLK